MFRAAALMASILALGSIVTFPTFANPPANVLMIIVDDVGVDMIGKYQNLEGSMMLAATPTIDNLASEGILFENAWSNPACAATRATIQTGQHGYRTNVLGNVPRHFVERHGIDVRHSDSPLFIVSGGKGNGRVQGTSTSPALWRGIGDSPALA